MDVEFEEIDEPRNQVNVEKNQPSHMMRFLKKLGIQKERTAIIVMVCIIIGCLALSLFLVILYLPKLQSEKTGIVQINATPTQEEK